MLQRQTSSTWAPPSLEDLEDVVAELEREVGNLEAALRSARIIGAAVGLVMQTHRLTHSEAMDHLRTRSQHDNLKLSVVADQLVQDADRAARRGQNSAIA
jgi:AmiR/NasT family two-component response regulator